MTGVGYAPEGYFMERGYKLTPNIDKTLQKLERVPCAMILSFLAPTLQPLNGRWSVIRRKALLTLVGKGGLNPYQFEIDIQERPKPFNSDTK